MADLAHYLYHRRFVNVMKNDFYRSSVHLDIFLYVVLLLPREYICYILNLDSRRGFTRSNYSN